MRLDSVAAGGRTVSRVWAGVLSLAACVCIAGCVGGSSVGDVVSCKVDGVSKTFTVTGALDSGGMTVVTGSATLGYPMVGITFPDSVGIYTGGGGSGSTLQWYPSIMTLYMATDSSGSFTINVTSNGARVTGTFSGTLPLTGGAGSVTITDGVFNVTKLL